MTIDKALLEINRGQKSGFKKLPTKDTRMQGLNLIHVLYHKWGLESVLV